VYQAVAIYSKNQTKPRAILKFYTENENTVDR
jgi:hypothetical protein